MAKKSTVILPPSVDPAVETPVTPAADMRQGGGPPRFVKIRFPDKRSRIDGVYRLMRQTRVVCLPNDEYVIARAGLSILEGSEIPHEVLEETSLDETLAALRDSPASLL